jgi:hypothetical protein
MGRYLYSEVSVSVKFFDRARKEFPEVSQESFSSVNFSEEVVVFNSEEADHLFKYLTYVADAAIKSDTEDRYVLSDALIMMRVVSNLKLEHEIKVDPEMTGNIDWSTFQVVFA